MSKVVANFKMGEFSVLVLDKMEKDFNKVEIDGTLYEVTIPYDIPNAIAIKSDNDFIGKRITFI